MASATLRHPQRVPVSEKLGLEGTICSPHYVRVPRNGQRCPVTGLCRSHINSLVLPTPGNNYTPAVRSVVLKSRGAIRGVRLVDVSSLISFIESQADSTPTRKESCPGSAASIDDAL